MTDCCANGELFKSIENLDDLGIVIACDVQGIERTPDWGLRLAPSAWGVLQNDTCDLLVRGGASRHHRLGGLGVDRPLLHLIPRQRL